MNLLFLNPTFHECENVTVRKGIKWANAFGENPEEQHPIFPTNDQTKLSGMAYILEADVKRFCNLTNEDISKEHDESCHNYQGLLKAMEAAYPDFTETDLVTVLHFWFIPVTTTSEE